MFHINYTYLISLLCRHHAELWNFLFHNLELISVAGNRNATEYDLMSNKKVQVVLDYETGFLNQNQITENVQSMCQFNKELVQNR